MTPHRLDALSGVLGVIAVASGLVVATGSTDRVTSDGGWWFALAVLAVGVAVVATAVRRLRDEPAAA